MIHGGEHTYFCRKLFSWGGCRSPPASSKRMATPGGRAMAGAIRGMLWHLGYTLVLLLVVVAGMERLG